MILLENSAYGDHQHGKISLAVVTFKEQMLLMTLKQKNSLIKL